MNRRAFISLLGGAVVAWPLAARAQRGERVRRIAVLMSNVEDDPEAQARTAAFRQGLQELGWSEGQNLHVDWLWSGGDIGRIRGYATEVAALAPDLVVANGAANLSAIKEAIRSIPIVFVVVSDPVGQGFISSLGRPGGNITGFSFVEYSMFGKSLELLRQVAPAVTRVAFMFNPDTVPFYDRFLPSFETEARKHSVEVARARVRNEAEIDGAVAELAAAPGGGLIVPPDTYTLVHRGLIVTSAARHRIPAIYSYRQVGQGRRPNVVRTRNRGHLPAVSFLCRSHLERSEPGRASGAGAHKIRIRRQSQDRNDARLARPTHRARACGRGDRMRSGAATREDGLTHNLIPCSQ